MTKKKGTNRGRQRRPVEQPKVPVSHRLHELRDKLWNAAAIVTCVEYVCESHRQNVMSDIQYTMEAVRKMIDEVTGEMEGIIKELGGPPDCLEEAE